MQRRLQWRLWSPRTLFSSFHSTLYHYSEGNNNNSNNNNNNNNNNNSRITSERTVSTSSASPPKGGSHSGSQPVAPAPTSTSQPSETLGLLREVQFHLQRGPARLGDLYQQLSPSARQVLQRTVRTPLEVLLRAHPGHFVLYKGGSSAGVGGSGSQVRKGPTARRPHFNVLYVALPHLVPASAIVLSSPPSADAPPSLASSPSSQPPQPQPAPYAVPRTEMDKCLAVYAHIPEVWTPFPEVPLPPAVKRHCMGYPTVRPLQYFLQYQQLYEVQRGTAQYAGLFSVRRHPHPPASPASIFRKG